MFSMFNSNKNSSDMIIKLLNLDFSIQEKFLNKIKFIDDELEKSFMNEENIFDEKFKIKSDLMIILGWFSIFIYIYLNYYRPLYIYSCLVFTLSSIIISCFRYFTKNRKTKLIIDHVQVFTQIIYLNLKAIYIILFLANQDNDCDNEIIRVITYCWVSTIIYLIQKLDGRPWVYLIFTLLNCSTISIIHLYSFNNHHYYLDAVSSLIVAIGGYFLKRFNEIKIRIIYGEKIKNEKISNYFLGFINGLNGCYMNYRNDGTISYSSKLKYEMESLNLYGNNEKIEINGIESIHEYKESDQFTFLNSSCGPNLPEKFLNSLKYFDKFTILKKQHLNNDFQNNESIFKNIKNLNMMNSNSNFLNIGIYYIDSPDGYKYYDIYYRKTILTEKNIIYDLVFYKATDLMVSLIKIEDENKQKNQIFAKLIHEFKTPLNSILGLIDNIKEKEQSDILTYKNDLNIIKNLSNYVIFLINDIIHYSSRKNYDDLNIIMNNFDIRNVVVFTFEILNSLLSCNLSKYKSIKTELEFEDDLHNLIVYSDETRLKQILLNLISNSVKFTNSGFIIIRCLKNKEKDSILLSVVDSGSGIRDENQKYIFNDYFMESEGYYNNIHGTGIGLSICKNLAKRMKMEVNFTSKFGIGSEFTLEIPTNRIRDYKLEYMKSTQFIPDNKNINEINNKKDINDSNLNFSNNSKYLFKNIDQENLESNMSSIRHNYEDINKNNNDNHSLLSRCIDFQNYKCLSSNNLETFKNIKNEMISNINNKVINVNNINNFQILIVDDDKYICNSIKILVKKIFKDMKCLVEVITGSDGLSIIKNVVEDQKKGNKIKCIITDENMEYLNGSDAIKIIRSLENESKIKNVKIITATSQEDILYIKNIKNKGSDIVMSKPLSKSNLTKAFQELKILNF